jgi:hypothetical protein
LRKERKTLGKKKENQRYLSTWVPESRALARDEIPLRGLSARKGTKSSER